MLYATSVGRLALIDEWERTAFAFGRELTAAEYARLVSWSELGAAYGVARGIVAVAGPSLLAAVVLLALYGRRMAGFRRTFAVVVHAGAILALRLVVSAPIDYLREATGGATSLSLLAPMLNPASAAARFLAAIDVFVLWWAGVLAIGASVLYGVPVRRAAGTLVTAYVALAAVLAGVMALLQTA